MDSSYHANLPFPTQISFISVNAETWIYLLIKTCGFLHSDILHPEPSDIVHQEIYCYIVALILWLLDTIVFFLFWFWN